MFGNRSLIYYGLGKVSGILLQKKRYFLLLEGGALSCLGTASLTRPISPKTQFYTYSHIVFCYQLKHPIYRVLLYHEIGQPSSQVEPSNNGQISEVHGPWTAARVVVLHYHN